MTPPPVPDIRFIEGLRGEAKPNFTPGNNTLPDYNQLLKLYDQAVGGIILRRDDEVLDFIVKRREQILKPRGQSYLEFHGGQRTLGAVQVNMCLIEHIQLFVNWWYGKLITNDSPDNFDALVREFEAWARSTIGINNVIKRTSPSAGAPAKIDVIHTVWSFA